MSCAKPHPSFTSKPHAELDGALMTLTVFLAEQVSVLLCVVQCDDAPRGSGGLTITGRVRVLVCVVTVGYGSR